MGGKIHRLLWIPALSVACWAESGVRASLVPDKVKPGEVFEMRVEMERADYARFKLEVPAVSGLHRVAVEPRPLDYHGGRYVQGESWLLQADRSGEFIIDGLSVTLDTKQGESVLTLPPLRLEVRPYAEEDASDAPLELPALGRGSGGISMLWWGLLIPALVLLGYLFRRSKGDLTLGAEPEVSSGGPVLAALREGRVPSSELGRLLEEQGDDWSEDLRSMVKQALYAGRADPTGLAEAMEEEGVR